MASTESCLKNLVFAVQLPWHFQDTLHIEFRTNGQSAMKVSHSAAISQSKLLGRAHSLTWESV
jgi:hypothetical protein